MHIPSVIGSMLARAGTSDRAFPPTMFYNEGWLLRLVLDWFSRMPRADHLLEFSPDGGWFSEALLPSRFLAGGRPDPLAEGYSHADGVIGHFGIGRHAIAETSLSDDATQFVVTEAKLFGRLSPGVTNAVYFDQAARSVACIAEVLRRSGLKPEKIDSLGFFVVAPVEQIDRGVFRREVDKESIREKVRRRVFEHADTEKDRFFEHWFLPTWHQIRVECLSWEAIVGFIRERDPGYGQVLGDFYGSCLWHNRMQGPV